MRPQPPWGGAPPPKVKKVKWFGAQNLRSKFEVNWAKDKEVTKLPPGAPPPQKFKKKIKWFGDKNLCLKFEVNRAKDKEVTKLPPGTPHSPRGCPRPHNLKKSQMVWGQEPMFKI